jgi:hypothetical protein
MKRKASSVSPYPQNVKAPIEEKSYDISRAIAEDEEEEKPYNSPTLEQVESLFKQQLLSFTTDILLNDLDSLKNISERGNKVLFHKDQLKMLIAILFLNSTDMKYYDRLISIETESVIASNCLCESCKSPFYEKIVSIVINNSVNFLHTQYATNMTSVFRISLDHCLTDNLKVF